MFDPVRGKPDFPANEAAIGRFWTEAGIAQKSLEQRRGGERFVFFEGPPKRRWLELANPQKFAWSQEVQREIFVVIQTLAADREAF